LKVHNVHYFYPIKRKQVEKARRCPQLILNTSYTTKTQNNVEVENKLKQVFQLYIWMQNSLQDSPHRGYTDPLHWAFPGPYVFMKKPEFKNLSLQSL